MKYYLTALILSLSLSSCTQAPSSAIDTAPPVKNYTKQQDTRVANELKECQAKTQLKCEQTIEDMKDYGVMRDQSRVGHINASTR